MPAGGSVLIASFLRSWEINYLGTTRECGDRCGERDSGMPWPPPRAGRVRTPKQLIRSYLALAKVVRFLKSKRVSLALKVRTHQGRASGNGDAYIFLLGSPDASTKENPGLG